MSHPSTSRQASISTLRLALLLGAASAPALAQSPSPSGLPPELLKQLEQLQKTPMKSPTGGEVKGWTCRDPEDGKRLHMVDVTNVGRMHKVPSSAAAFNDNKTELSRLPLCKRPD